MSSEVRIIFFPLSDTNRCGNNNGGCEQFCLPDTESKSYTCECMNGYYISPDNKKKCLLGKNLFLSGLFFPLFFLILCEWRVGEFFECFMSNEHQKLPNLCINTRNASLETWQHFEAVEEVSLEK